MQLPLPLPSFTRADRAARASHEEEAPDRQIPLVFCSYNKAEEAQMEGLVLHLQAAMGSIDLFTDQHGIEAGDDWHEKIQEALRTCSVAILFLSPEFLLSNYIRKHELPRLFKRWRRGEVWILPILVKPCLWEAVTELRPIQRLPFGGKAISELDNPERELLAIAKYVLQRLGVIPPDDPDHPGAGAILPGRRGRDSAHGRLASRDRKGPRRGGTDLAVFTIYKMPVDMPVECGLRVSGRVVRKVSVIDFGSTMESLIRQAVADGRQLLPSVETDQLYKELFVGRISALDHGRLNTYELVDEPGESWYMDEKYFAMKVNEFILDGGIPAQQITF